MSAPAPRPLPAPSDPPAHSLLTPPGAPTGTWLPRFYRRVWLTTAAPTGSPWAACSSSCCEGEQAVPGRVHRTETGSPPGQEGGWGWVGAPCRLAVRGGTIPGFGKDHSWASQVALVVENPPVSARDVRDAGSISGSGRSPGGGHGKFSSVAQLCPTLCNPLQYSCLENPQGQRSLGATLYRVTQSQT